MYGVNSYNISPYYGALRIRHGNKLLTPTIREEEREGEEEKEEKEEEEEEEGGRGRRDGEGTLDSMR